MRLLTLMALSLWSNTAIAESPGKFTFLGLNQCAPFEGVLFDPPATAFILSEAQASTVKLYSVFILFHISSGVRT